MLLSLIFGLLAIRAVPGSACDSCYGPNEDAVHVRHVRRMQPDAQAATDSPTSDLVRVTPERVGGGMIC